MVAENALPLCCRMVLKKFIIRVVLYKMMCFEMPQSFSCGISCLSESKMYFLINQFKNTGTLKLVLDIFQIFYPARFRVIIL